MDKHIYQGITIKTRSKWGVLILALLIVSACTSQERDFSIIFGGDIMLARNGSPLFEYANQDTSPWGTVRDSNFWQDQNGTRREVFAANLESPLGYTDQSDEMNLCSSPAAVGILTQAHLDLLSIANNHQDDCQAIGQSNTDQYLADAGIRSSGVEGVTQYLEVNNHTIAWIAADDVASPVDTGQLESSVQDARQNAEYVIVSMHWGSEYQAGPNDRQEEIASLLAEAGADIIWGHHPHVLQRMEWIPSSSGRQTLVMYSLGNLLSDQWMLDESLRTALVKISFSGSQIKTIEVLPLLMDRSTRQLKTIVDESTRLKIIDRLSIDSLETAGVVIDY